MLKGLKGKKIMLIYGGGDVEGDVSVNSAKNVKASLVRLGYNFAEHVFNPQTLKSDLAAYKPDIVFNAMHGKWGEDGILPKILDYENIAYTHSGFAPSLMGINKMWTYEIAKSLGIKTPQNRSLVSKWHLLDNGFVCKNTERAGKMIIKPNSQGSSIGCYFVEKADIIAANGVVKLHQNAKNFIKTNSEQFYIVEDAFDGFELTSGIFNNKNIGSIKISPKVEGFYNYTAKYTVGQTVYEVNPLIKTELIKQIEADTLAMHKAIGANFVSRCDFLVNTNQTDYVFLEINTHPGLTQTSLIPKMVEANQTTLKIFDDYHNPNPNLNFYDKMVDIILLNAIIYNV